MELSKFKEKLLESLIGNLLMFGLNLLLPLVVSRFYGIEVYGKYVYGITIISIALFTANIGMDVGLLYFIPKTEKKYISACFLINILTIFFVFYLE